MQSASAAFRFHPLRVHARGGLGEVLIARDGELNRAVALKRILPHQADNPDARGRFVLEAEITGRLEHPGIVPVYGFGSDPATGQPYYAMRFISGRSLDAAVGEFHSRPPIGYEGLAFRKLLQSFVSVCQTIGYAHSRGVIHRDIKPANVMLGAFGETLVVDWGLAKATGVAGGSSSARPRSVIKPSADVLPEPPLASSLAHYGQAPLSSLAHSGQAPPSAVGSRIGSSAGSLAVSRRQPDTRSGLMEPTDAAPAPGSAVPDSAVASDSAPLGSAESATLPSGSEVLVPGSGSGSSGTMVGAILGTAGYMAPEQATGDVNLLGSTADIYALGATLYHLLVGHRPLEGYPSQAILLRTSLGQIPPVRKLRPSVPAALAAICARAMALHPDDRYPSAGELAADVERWLADEPVSCLSESRSAQARRWARRHPGKVGGIAAAVAVAAVAAIVGIAVLGGLNRRLESALADATAAQAQEARARGAAESAQAQEAQARRDAEQARSDEVDARRDEAAARQRAVANFRAADAAIDEFLARVRARTSLFTSTELRSLRDELLEGVLTYSRQVQSQKAGSDKELAGDLAASGRRVGEVLIELGRLRESLDAAQGSAVELERLLAENPGDAALRRQSAANLTIQGLVLLRMGQSDRSEAAYRRALELRRQLAGLPSATAEDRRDLGAACFNLGNAHQNAGQHDAAETLYREALRHLLSADARDPKVEDHLIIVRQYLSDLMFAADRFREAEQIIRDNLEVMNAQGRRFPNSRDVAFRRAAVHIQLGNTAAATGQRDVARDCYDASQRLLSVLVARHPDVQLYWVELSHLHNKRGVSLLSGSAADLDEAEQHFYRAVEIDQRVLRDAPGDHDALTTLGGNYCNLGILCGRREQFDKALIWLNKAVETLTPVARDVRKFQTPQQFLRNAHDHRARVLLDLGKPEAAAADWQKLVELTDGAQRTIFRLGLATSLASAGQHQRAGEVMELAQAEAADIDGLMNAATAWVHCAEKLQTDLRMPAAERAATIESYLRRAVANVRRAGELGLRDVKRIRETPDLAPLREREDFRRVLEEIARRPARQP